MNQAGLAILFIFLISSILLVFVSWSRLKRRRTPMVRGVFEESLDAQKAMRIERANIHGSPNIEHMIERINEIERKIEIIRMQNISDEAKRIAIKELEEEKRMLEEKIRGLNR